MMMVDLTLLTSGLGREGTRTLDPFLRALGRARVVEGPSSEFMHLTASYPKPRDELPVAYQLECCRVGQVEALGKLARDLRFLFESVVADALNPSLDVFNRMSEWELQTRLGWWLVYRDDGDRLTICADFRFRQVDQTDEVGPDVVA